MGRLWLCTDILKLTINSGASVIKCVKTVGEESKTTNPKAVSSGHVETNTDIQNLKELNTSFNYNVLYTDIWLLYLTYFLYVLDKSVICVNMRPVSFVIALLKVAHLSLNM